MMYPRVFTLTVLSCVLISCSDELPVNSGSRGEIWGRIVLPDRSGQDVADRRGVTVTLEGTAHSGVSDADGKWEIENVPPGVYSVRFTKPGYSFYILPNTQFVGDGELFLQHILLSELPSVTVVDQTISPIQAKPNEFTFSVTLSEALPTYTSIFTFYRADPDADFVYSKSTEAPVLIADITDNTRFHGTLSLADLGLPAGTTVHLVTVPSANLTTTLSYFDPVRNDYLYVGVNEAGASPIATVTIQ